MPSEITIGDDSLTITRVFAAFTDPTQLAKCWGCRDAEHVSAELDPRAGGSFRIVLRLKNGFEMVEQGVYEELPAGRGRMCRRMEPLAVERACACTASRRHSRPAASRPTTRGPS